MIKTTKKNIDDAINFVYTFINTPDLHGLSESERQLRKALTLLTKNKVITEIKIIGKLEKKCMFCQKTDLENNCFKLPCNCFEYSHKTCIKGTALLMSPDLNQNNIKITCPICAKLIPFDGIQSCFSQDELLEIKNKFTCKFCDKIIPGETNENILKICPEKWLARNG